MEIKRTFDPSSDTKARVVAAATRLFAEKGMEKVALRELTSAAGVNLAAVNYHFGTKEALCEAVLDSLAERVNARRLANLGQVLDEARRAGRRPALPAILDTFIAPYLDDDASATDGAVLVQLLIKDRVSPSDMTARIIRKHFDPLARAYIAAFALACPNVAPDDFYWRYMLTYNTVILTASDRDASRIATMSMGRLDGADRPALRQALADYLAAAIGAPSRTPPG
ncbi:MAG: TetR/AcrR family transcriptional regulator [Ottowia sp.]|uniref:TetR/AcrR family transcriptional regulator n=1 Tax=Ottowia sp. TaxID=1898956 RepID=UPI0039E31A59